MSRVTSRVAPMRALASALVAVAAVAVVPGTARAADETTTAGPATASAPTAAEMLDARAAAIRAAAAIPASEPTQAKPAKVLPNFTARSRAAIRATRSASVFRWGSAAYAKWYAKAHIDAKYHWGASQFGCLVSLWNRESHWNFQAVNRWGRAFGIPQTKIGNIRAYGVAYGTFMQTPELQVQVGANYIHSRYGSPCNAYAHARAYGWY